MDKNELRQHITKQIEELSDERRQAIEADLRNQLTQTTEWQQAKTIGITLSHELEWDTYKTIEKAWNEGKIVVVPKCIHKTKEMIFYRIDSFDDVKAGYAGILEPIESETTKWDKQAIDLLVVPGRVFDKTHYRIGFGGGYYDRFLADFNQPTISLVWEGQLVDQVPTNQYDLPVDQLVVSTL